MQIKCRSVLIYAVLYIKEIFDKNLNYFFIPRFLKIMKAENRRAQKSFLKVMDFSFLLKTEGSEIIIHFQNVLIIG